MRRSRAARLAAGLPLLFETEVESVNPDRGVIRFSGDELQRDVIAGCDGFHGVCRRYFAGTGARTEADELGGVPSQVFGTPPVRSGGDQAAFQKK